MNKQKTKNTNPMSHANPAKLIIATLVATFTLSGCSIKYTPPKHTGGEGQLVGVESVSEFGIKNKVPNENKNQDNNKSAKRKRNEYELNEVSCLRVVISKNGYTRFSIEGERITDVFVYPQEEVAVQIHNQGYLIIAPIENTDVAGEGEGTNARPELHMTITGEDGTVQDIMLSFGYMNPEPVRLIKPKNKSF